MHWAQNEQYMQQKTCLLQIFLDCSACYYLPVLFVLVNVKHVQFFGFNFI